MLAQRKDFNNRSINSLEDSGNQQCHIPGSCQPSVLALRPCKMKTNTFPVGLHARLYCPVDACFYKAKRMVITQLTKGANITSAVCLVNLFIFMTRPFTKLSKLSPFSTLVLFSNNYYAHRNFYSQE